MSSPRLLSPGLLVAVLLPAVIADASGNTIAVPSDSTTIQAALYGAAPGDTILVAPGTYGGPANRDLDFQGKDVLLLSEQGPAVTIIDGQGAGRVFLFDSGETAAARVVGFTITGGSAADGGAVRCTGGSSPSLIGCVLAGNAATGSGGALQADAGSSPSLVSCTLSGNVAGSSGGGIAAASPAGIALTQCIVWGNCAPAGPEVSAAAGAAISFSCSDVNPFGVDGAVSYLNDTVFEDPLFCAPVDCANPGPGTLTVLDCSPVLPGNNACGLLMGALPAGCTGVLTATVPADFVTIQEAIDAACPGATIHVDPGTYTGPGNRNLNFRGKDLILLGAGSSLTMLDCGGAGRAFDVTPGDHDVLVEGFTVWNGEVVDQGGAVRIVNASPHFRDCVFSGNAVSLGENGGGGAIYCLGGAPEFEGCLITGNRSATTGGAVVADSLATPRFVGCTIAGNTAEDEGGGISVSDSSKVTLEESILWGNCAASGDDAHIPERSDTLSFACSSFNFAAIAGLGPILTPDANVFGDPLFCSALSCGSVHTGGDYTLDAQSPCLADNNACGVQIGARDAGCGLIKSPEILAVTDVPNDQGRQVRVSWRRSGLDREGSPTTISTYEVYRLIDSTLVVTGIEPGASSTDLERWDYLLEVRAHGSEVYSVIVPTLADSSILGGLYTSTFAVRAATGIPHDYFDSDPASGYSVDNLSPGAPQSLIVARDDDANLLSWAESEVADFLRFLVYRGGSEDFVPGPGTLIHQTVVPAFRDEVPASPAVYYKVTVMDFSGNQSAAALGRAGSTPVVLLGFTAARTGTGADISWRIAGESTDHLGFRLHRETAAGDREPLHAGVLEGRSEYHVVDPDPPAGDVRYWLAELSRAGETTWYGPAVLPGGGARPLATSVRLAPNPFRTSTFFHIELAEAGPVRLRLFDAAGREIGRPLEASLEAGVCETPWDGRDARGARVPPGVYFYRLETRAGARNGKLVVVE